MFPSNVSQSTIDGREGSNACTFIALCFGSIYHLSDLPTPAVGQPLSILWEEAVKKAIRTGNRIYDESIKGDGINVAVDEAVAACRDHGPVVEMLRQYDASGEEPLSQFSEKIKSILQQKQSFHVLVANGKTMMIVVDKNGTLIFIDSHIHGHGGALVARSDPYQEEQAESFSTWVNQMLSKSDGVGLSICSLTTVTFEQKEKVDTI